MTRSRRKLKKKQEDKKGMLLVFVAICLIVGFGYFYYQLQSKFIQRDTVSLCRNDGYSPRETALLVDATETYSDAQAILVAKHLEMILNDSLVDERFTFYSLDEDVVDFRPDFKVCNPGDGSDQSEFTANKRRLFNNWESSFYNRIVSSVDELIGDEPAELSPIMEMLKYVSIQTMFGSESEKKRIIVISDMLHNTAQFSHYGSQKSYEDIDNSSYAREVRPMLEGVDVEILYIVRSGIGNIQNTGHIQEFWRPFINDANGRIVAVDSVN